MSKRRLGLSTTAIHGKPKRQVDGTPISMPLLQSATFVNPVGSHEEVMYTRYGNNPTVQDAAAKIALLEGADDGILLSSGMGATALAHLAVLRPGDHLISSAWIYGGTKALFTEEFGKLGISVSFVDPTKPREWKNHVREETRALFLETPTNPTARVLDLRPPVSLCRRMGFVLLVDSTFSSPINFRPIEHGADVVIHSATKYLNGHGDVIAGAVVGNHEVVAEVRELLKRWGQAIDPHAAWLISRGLKTLTVRMARHNANGMAFARWAAEHPKIQAVHYPGLEDHPDHELAKEVLDGFGGVVGIVVKGGVKAAEAVLRKLKVISHAPSLGTVETIVSEPRLTSHAALSSSERVAQGIPDGFIRVSVGLEDVEDLTADFERGLAAL